MPMVDHILPAQQPNALSPHSSPATASSSGVIERLPVRTIHPIHFELDAKLIKPRDQRTATVPKFASQQKSTRF